MRSGLRGKFMLNSLEKRNTVSPGDEESVEEKLREGRMNKDDGADVKSPSLREFVKIAREKESKGGEKMESALNPAKMGTSSLLKWAWGVLIPSFGLSLIWINIHVFLRLVLGEKLFCKLGEEWIPKQASSALGEEGKMAGKGIGLVEVMGLIFLDLVVLFVMLTSLAVLILLVDAYLHPIKTLWNFWGIGWDLALEAIGAFFRQK